MSTASNATSFPPYSALSLSALPKGLQPRRLLRNNDSFHCFVEKPCWRKKKVALFKKVVDLPDGTEKWKFPFLNCQNRYSFFALQTADVEGRTSFATDLLGEHRSQTQAAPRAGDEFCSPFLQDVSKSSWVNTYKDFFPHHPPPSMI